MKSIDELQSETIDNLYKQIGINVKTQRMKMGYTQLELSQALGHKSVGLVSQAELYLKKQHFSLKHLYQISYVLECDLLDLIQFH